MACGRVLLPADYIVVIMVLPCASVLFEVVELVKFAATDSRTSETATPNFISILVTFCSTENRSGFDAFS